MQKQSLPLNALRAFSAIYETGGIRSAARVLDVTHSSVSRHLRFLEITLGVALLDRDQNQNSLVFTAQGERLGQVTNEAMSMLDNAIVEIRENHTRNSVVISTAPSFASRWLMERIHIFSDEYPKIEVSVLAEQQLTKLTDHGADIGIRIGSGAWAEAEYRALMDETLFPVCTVGYAEKLGDTGDPLCLKKARLLHDRDQQASWEVWRKKFGLDWLDSASGPRYTSSDIVLDAASKGLGVALARGRMAEAELREGHLIRILEPLEITIPSAYWMLVNPESADRKAVQTFVSWIKAECELPEVRSQNQTVRSAL